MPASDHPPSSQRAALIAEIAELQEELAVASHPRTRIRIEADIAELQAQLATLDAGETPPPPTAPVNQSGQSGGTSLGANNTLHGPTHIGDDVGRDKLEQHVDSVQAARDAFVATQQTIYCYYGDQPPVNAATLLSNYLAYFAAECNHLRLQRMVDKGQRDVDQSAVPELRLQAVYTSLTTNGPPVVRLRTTTTAGRVRRFLERLEKIKRGPGDVRPERVIAVNLAQSRKAATYGPVEEALFDAATPRFGLDQLDDATPITLELQRPELAIEALALQRWLVLLGEPGSGKSTVLRY
ncbi:MAG: hypothetical protein EI684_15685, partial [Candidatus Viridilinea halotolerans]